MVHYAEINQAPSPYSMLQHIGRVATLKLVPRTFIRYLQTTLIMGGGGTNVSEFMWGILGTKFRLELTILPFWTKFAQKGCFRPKTEKVNSTIEFCVFKLVYVPNFSLNWQFWFCGPSLSEKGVFGLKQKERTSPLNSAYSN